jgi:hypothetical protein
MLQNVFLVRVVQQRRQLSALLSVLSVLPDRARDHPRHHQHSRKAYNQLTFQKIQINYLAKNQQTKLLGSIEHKTPQSVHGFRTKRSQTNKTLTPRDSWWVSHGKCQAN